MEQVQQVEAAKEDVDFVCGGNLFPEEHPLHRFVGLQTDISCNSHASPLFYFCKRGFTQACCASGDKNPLPLADAVRAQYQSVNPLCQVCRDQGLQLRTRGKRKV